MDNLVVLRKKVGPRAAAELQVAGGKGPGGDGGERTIATVDGNA